MSDLTLEKIKVAERLTTLETKFDSIEVKVNTIYKCIVGNGDVGLKTKVELLVEKDKEHEVSNNRLWTAVITTAVGFVGKAVWDFIKK